MSGDERGTKRPNPDTEIDHGEAQRPEKAVASSSAPATERMEHTTHIPSKGSATARSQTAEPTGSYLVAGQRAVDTIIERLSTGTPRAAIESFALRFLACISLL